MGCDLCLRKLVSRLNLFQSTHPHGVRLGSPRQRIFSLSVSIHAPTWGATLLGNRIHYFVFSFNPRTHMGCDVSLVKMLKMICSFNPRTHMGCDASSLDAIGISSKFQSTHPHGVRRFAVHQYDYNLEFQSTHPHGVRLMCGFAAQGAAGFQSTHPHGVRHVQAILPMSVTGVSIHAPTWGAT